MERRICVRVSVSNEAHADKIRDEIEQVVKYRTTIYHVGKPHRNGLTIEQIGKACRDGIISRVAPHEWDD